MRRSQLAWLLTLFIVLLGAQGQTLAQALQTRTGDSLVIENEYISIIVNGRAEDTGRFSVNTTGGDPARAGDEQKPLVYGTERAPGPWTSYTTVRIDGRDYVFGGPTGKRAGRTGLYGEMVRAPYIHEGREIRAVWRMEDIVVTQILGFAAGITTGQMDTARIEYVITNEGSRTRNVGLRIMLDTMLGANDGAPFQVSGEALLTDMAFRGEAIPDYFQAFDSLANPQVVSQGTLRALDTTVPDAVYFSNWGSLADGTWDFDFVPGRDFTRAGEEFVLDSAVALYWDPRPLAPGESRRYITYYGLGGITIAPGHLSLGVTSPQRIEGSHTDPVVFEIRAYVENTGEWIARDTVVRLENLAPLELVQGQASVALGDLAPRQARQVVWRVAAPPGSAGDFVYRVSVTSSNAEPNRVDRQVTIIAPAYLSATMGGVDQLRVVDGRWAPVPFVVTAQVTNSGQLEAQAVEAEIRMPIGLAVAKGDDPLRRLGAIRPGETVTVEWHLIPTGAVGNLPVSLQLRADAARIDPRLPTHFVSVPRLDGALRVAVFDEQGGSRNTFAVGELFHVEVLAHSVRELYGVAFELHFDPRVLQVLGGRLGVGPGRAFVKNDPVTGEEQLLNWVRPVFVDNRAGVVRVIASRAPEGPLTWLSDSLATIRFRAVGPGQARLRFVLVPDNPFLSPDAQRAYIADGSGNAVDVMTEETVITVRVGEP